MSADPRTATARAALALEQTIATALGALPVAQERRHRLRRDLLDRVQRSAQAHRLFKTVRREDPSWTTIGPGVQQCPLSSQEGLRVDLLKLAPGTELPWVEASLAQEVLVVEGALSMPGTPAAAADMAPEGHRVLDRSAAGRPVAGRRGATLYVRSRIAALDRLPRMRCVLGLQVLPMHDETLDDALRLLYVGMTRATHELVLSAQGSGSVVEQVRRALADVGRQLA